jgi:uncharacterized membrane protein
LELGRFFGFIHPALVHFPLVLLLVSVGLEAIGFFGRNERFAWAAQLTLVLGTVATLFAFVCGNFAEIWAARDGIPQEPMEQHELLATITSWLFVFLTAGRLFLGVGTKRRWMAAYLVIALAGCILLGFTGHRGAMLVYQHGAGVQNGDIQPQPTHEDLAVLMQKQDPASIFYSNYMHHVFGWMVLILAGMLLVDMISPQASERLRRVGPLLLLAGGIFLMIYSDTDSWPLSAQRPITDKEVLMHKTYAVLMLFFGLRGLWRRRGRAAPSRQVQGRMMAVFALVGGALLFTHVHSAAPYANVAVGVYVHHTVMGFIALSIGAVKLLEDILPATSKLRRRRALAWAYAGLMGMEAIFLLNYNEGLPWFLGYRDLNTVGPHKGLIAPLGRDRAELIFDPATARLDLYLLAQHANRPRPIAADSVQVVVRVGTDATIVPLTAVPGPGGSAHFTGTATFLRTASLFQTQAFVPGSSPSAQSAPRVADFEPWVDPTSVHNHPSLAAYVCPMHPWLGAGAPGYCPVCGMRLVPNRAPRPWDKLHDDTYRLDLALTARSPAASPVRYASLQFPTTALAQYDRPIQTLPITQPLPDQTVHLTFMPRRADGTVVNALDVVHTKKLHLIIVRSDLSFFDHVHPIPHADGTLTLDYAFPTPGDYLLYADLTPTGDRNQVFRLPVTVAGTPLPAQPLLVTPARASVFGDYRVELRMTPDPPQARDETLLAFTISQNGVPVTDLQPYLGAGGHCVALSADTRGYLHSHPLEMGGTRFGPTITFHTLFPRSGLYKVWAQFQHQGHILTADFVVRVP